MEIQIIRMRVKILSLGLVFIFVLGLAFLGLAGSLGGMKTGADTIANELVSNESSYVDFTDQEWDDWMNGVVQYNVDVKITSGHAFEKHGNDTVNAAMRCVNEHGSTAVISENQTRYLHIFCQDPDTKEEYVVIITKIKKAIDQYRNATSELVTAFKLRTQIGENIGSYIQRMVVDNKYAIIVKLAFKAGELFFSPF